MIDRDLRNSEFQRSEKNDYQNSRSRRDSGGKMIIALPITMKISQVLACRKEHGAWSMEHVVKNGPTILEGVQKRNERETGHVDATEHRCNQ